MVVVVVVVVVAVVVAVHRWWGLSGHEKGLLKKVESRTITRARIIPVTIPAPGLSQRVYRPL